MDVRHQPGPPSVHRNLWHTIVLVAGGLDMIQLTRAMKDDADAQEHIVELLNRRPI
jgi:hypothetical protein